MQLYAPFISVQGKSQIRYAVNNFAPELIKTTFLSMMIQDGFGVVDFSDLLATMKRIVADSKQKN